MHRVLDAQDVLTPIGHRRRGVWPLPHCNKLNWDKPRKVYTLQFTADQHYLEIQCVQIQSPLKKITGRCMQFHGEGSSCKHNTIPEQHVRHKIARHSMRVFILKPISKQWGFSRMMPSPFPKEPYRLISGGEMLPDQELEMMRTPGELL